MAIVKKTNYNYTPMGYFMVMNNEHAADHREHLNRVNRIEGQVRGIKNMIEGGQYCVDILTQIKAIRSALKGLELQILEGHAQHCLLSALTLGREEVAKEKIDEIMNLIKKSSKS